MGGTLCKSQKREYITAVDKQRLMLQERAAAEKGLQINNIDSVLNRPQAKMVSADVSHEQWAHNDLIVFEPPRNKQKQLDFNADPNGVRTGQFFSKRRQDGGIWKMDENSIELVFNGDNDEKILATAQASERIWTNPKVNLEMVVLAPEVLPIWFAPRVLSTSNQQETLTSQNFECPVCFFELHKLPVGILRNYQRRCSPHYYHIEYFLDLK